MTTVTANVVVQFGGSSGNISAELDGREDGYNNGKSSFGVGDEPVILVRKSDDVTISQVISSIGSVGLHANGYTEEEEVLTYARAKSASTAKPISSLTSTQWIGNSLGAIKKVGNQDLVIDTPNPVTGAGCLLVKYRSNFVAYKLTGIPSKVNGKSKFSVVIVVVGNSV